MATEGAGSRGSGALRRLVALALGLGIFIAAAPAWAEPDRERDPHTHLRDWGQWSLDGSHDPVSQRAVRRALPPRRKVSQRPLADPAAGPGPHVVFRAVAFPFQVAYTVVTVVEVAAAVPLLFVGMRCFAFAASGGS